MRERTEKIRVSVVTGFLGAGKTTLLRHLLHESSPKRFAIVENEFGSVGMDGAILGKNEVPVYELNGGCICCSVREDLVEVFTMIADRPDPPEHLLVEDTGLAQPAPILRIFEDDGLGEAFCLDGIITVVDAMHIQQSLKDGDACAEQIAGTELF